MLNNQTSLNFDIEITIPNSFGTRTTLVFSTKKDVNVNVHSFHQQGTADNSKALAGDDGPVGTDDESPAADGCHGSDPGPQCVQLATATADAPWRGNMWRRNGTETEAFNDFKSADGSIERSAKCQVKHTVLTVQNYTDSVVNHWECRVSATPGYSRGIELTRLQKIIEVLMNLLELITRLRLNFSRQRHRTTIWITEMVVNLFQVGDLRGSRLSPGRSVLLRRHLCL